jgi:hypothetical protein
MMRLGLTLQQGYLIILASLVFLIGAGTIYGLWTEGKAQSEEALLVFTVDGHEGLGLALAQQGLVDDVVLLAFLECLEVGVLLFLPFCIAGKCYGRKQKHEKNLFHSPVFLVLG